MKAQGVLARKKVEPVERVEADKKKLGRVEALTLAREAAKVVSIRGKQVTVFDLKKDKPSDDELAAAILGPFGNLRAPALRRGTTLIVGFNEAAYRDALT